MNQNTQQQNQGTQPQPQTQNGVGENQQQFNQDVTAQSLPAITASQLKGANAASGNPDQISLVVKYNAANRTMENTITFDVDHRGVARVTSIKGDGTAAQRYIPMAFAAENLRRNPAVSEVPGVPQVEFIYSHLTGEPQQTDEGSQQDNKNSSSTGRGTGNEVEHEREGGVVSQATTNDGDTNNTQQDVSSSQVQSATEPQPDQQVQSATEPQLSDSEAEGLTSDVEAGMQNSIDDDLAEESTHTTKGVQEPPAENEHEDIAEGVEEETKSETSDSDIIEPQGGWEEVDKDNKDYLVAFSHDDSENLLSLWDTEVVVGEEDHGMGDYVVNYENNDNEDEDDEQLIADTMNEAKNKIETLMVEKP